MTFKPQPLKKVEDYFTPTAQRKKGAVYCHRLNGWHPNLAPFLLQFYQQATTQGLVQREKLPNPTQSNLEYYQEIIGTEFYLQLDFLSEKLSIWLPRLNGEQNVTISIALYETLYDLQQAGKTPSMLKNIFTKFMCWMYYRLERLLRQLGGATLPKILYQGEVSDYELRLFSVLSKAGCDLLLLQLQGDGSYKTLDVNNKVTQVLTAAQTGDTLVPFSPEFSLEGLLAQEEQQQRRSTLYQGENLPQISTNQWSKEGALEDILTPSSTRGGTSTQMFPCFRSITGVAEKAYYLPQLLQFHQELITTQRDVVVLEEIPLPTPGEIEKIPRKQYTSFQQMVEHIASLIRMDGSPPLQSLLRKAFLESMESHPNVAKDNLNRQTNQGITLLCWLQRYQSQLWKQWTPPKLSCLILLHGCNHPNQVLFLEMLSLLPVDILLLHPQLDRTRILPPKAKDQTHPHSLVVESFPTGAGEIQMGTVAYHAERELDGLMYTDSGMYRNQQYPKATALPLRTMYEEIAILWNTEAKLRPNFSTHQNTVNVPNLFAKVSGVKDGNVSAYWSGIKALCTPETKVVTRVPFLTPYEANPIKDQVAQFYRQGKLDRTALQKHHNYPYGFLRQESQDHILDKLELLLSRELIRGTHQNGTAYTIIATVLGLDNDFIRRIQQFDFTKIPPKLLYLHTKEGLPTLEDGIMMAFLHLVGFDIVMFVPTGYQGTEVHFSQPLMEEHQIGTYLYDLQPPNLKPTKNPLSTLGDKLFKRGG